MCIYIFPPSFWINGLWTLEFQYITYQKLIIKIILITQLHLKLKFMYDKNDIYLYELVILS